MVNTDSDIWHRSDCTIT